MLKCIFFSLKTRSVAFVRFLGPENVVIILRDRLEVPERGQVIFERWHPYSGKTGRKGAEGKERQGSRRDLLLSQVPCTLPFPHTEVFGLRFRT